MVKLILSLIFKSVILFALYLLGCRLPFINNILVVLFFYFIGQGLYKVFEDFLGKDDQVYKAALSITLGITAYFLSFLTLGHLGGAINRSSQLMLGILLLVVSEIILAFKTSIKTEYKKLERIDYVFWIVFVLFFGYCMFVINTYFFSPWDDFTYWLLDAKVIYEASKLRDSLRVLNLFNYTSYYPLHAVFIYNIFNRIAEQFASFFTVLYAALATIIIYRSNSNKPENTKILAVLLTLIVNMSFITNQMLLFCSYAEVVVAFNIMLFLHFLIKDYNDKNYPSRVFLLLLTLLIVFLIKTNNLYYCLVLSILWLFYDYRSIKDNLRSLISFKVIWFLLILTIIAISRYYYTHKIFINTVPGLLKPTEILPHNIFNLPFKYIRYSFFIFAHLTKNYLLSLLASFFIVYLHLKHELQTKEIG